MFGYALVFFLITLSALTLFDLLGFASYDERQKLQNLGGAFALAILSASLREAVKSKENPLAFRAGALLLAANLYCFVSDSLAFDRMEEPAAPSGPSKRWLGFSAAPASSVPTVLRFATKHVVATLLSLVLHFVISTLSIVRRFVQWRFATLDDQGAAPTASTRRVLILYANVGSGHKMAALALEAAFQRRGAPGLEVLLIDAMECCPSFFRYQFQTLFQRFTQSLLGQHFLGLAYDAADKGRAKAEAQRFFESFVSLELIKKVAALRPEVVLCTHFLPAQVLAELRNPGAGLLRGNRLVQAQARALPLALVLTDLDLQFMWVNDVDRYFVPRAAAAHMLEAYGGLAGGATATVTGIPIFPAFADKAKDARSSSRAAEQASRKRELAAVGAWEGSVLGGAWPDATDPRPTLLFVSSGNLVLQIYENLLASATPLRLIVCTGRQADVRAQLEAATLPPRHVVKMLGFVADRPPTPGGMPTLLRCADLFVGKSGGLAVAEAAALRVPMIVLDPIPGQEQRNCDVLLEAGAAVKINDLPLLRRRVDEILGGGGAKAKAMAASMAELGRPDAAFEIVDTVINKEIVPIHTVRQHQA